MGKPRERINMTKNMTRKGLALGSAAALIATGFSALPANAAGLADTGYVTLTPTTGTEYTVLHDQFFDLNASFADTLAGVSTRDLKFKIDDASLGTDFRYDIDINGATADVNANAKTGTVDGGSNIFTIASVAHGLSNLDLITIDTAVTSDNGANFAAAATTVITVIDVDSFSIVSASSTTGSSITVAGGSAATTAVSGFKYRLKSIDFADESAAVASGVATVTVASTGQLNVGETVTLAGFDPAGTGEAALLNGARVIASIPNATTFTFATTAVNDTDVNASGRGTVTPADTTDQVLTSAALLRATVIGNDRLVGTSTTLTTNTLGEYLTVDSTLYSVGDAATLRLVNNTATTNSVVVTAWMDSNNNNLIDSVEYVSPSRTVTFQKASLMTVATAMTPIIGDTSLTATVTTTPVLNGQQVIAQDTDWLNVGFTRQNSTVAVMFGADDATATSVWSDVSKKWTVDVPLAVNADGTTTNGNIATNVTGATDGAWLGLAAPAASIDTTAIGVSTTGLVTITDAAHGLTTGDKVTMVVNTTDATVVLAAETSARTVSVLTADVFTYQVSEITGFPTAAASDASLESTSEYTVATYGTAPTYLVGRVFAGDYTARAYVLTNAQGNLVSAGTAAATSSTLAIATTGSATVQGKSYTAEAGNTTYVKTGTLSVPVTITVTDAKLAAVSAGRPVVVTLAASGTSDTFKVNAKLTTDTVYTDANGQVTVTVTSAAGTTGSIVAVKAVAEGVATADIDLEWAAQAFNLVDMAVTSGNYAAGSNPDVVRTIPALGSYSFNFAVTDQFYTAAASDTYRLNVTGEGVAASNVTLVDGKATVTITDSGAEGTDLDTDVILQKLTSGVWTAVGTYDVLTNINKVAKINVAADSSTLYSSTAADLSAGVAAKALVELDKRTSMTAVPVYGAANVVRLSGQVVNNASSAGLRGAVVTVSGASNLLFVDTATENVYKRGSLTFVSTEASGATAGQWEVLIYSTTAQKDTVVTITANGVTSTAKVTFTGTGVGEGTSLVVTAPAAVQPASTFQVKAKLTDVYGNAVTAAAGRIKVTYVGAGIVFGTLPTSTDATGELSFAVLLGSNDTGTVSVTVSYDQNGDADFVDAKDLTTTSSTVINATGVVASAEKVNVGSFKGYVALYAKGYAGKKMSAIVAGKWIVVASLATDFERVVRYTGAGYDIVTTIYIDGVSVQSFNVTTK
jgi:hypothetical protein